MYIRYTVMYSDVNFELLCNISTCRKLAWASTEGTKNVRMGGGPGLISSLLNTETWLRKTHSARVEVFLPRCMECRRGLAMRIPSVCPSVRLSVRQTRELWQNGIKICLDFYTIRKIIYPSFLRKRMFGGGDPSTWNFGSTGPHWSEIADFEPIIARSVAVRSSEKKFN